MQMAKTTGLASIAEGSTDLHKIDPRKLKIKPGWNSRDFTAADNIEYIDGLAKSIAEVGVKEPLTVLWEKGEAFITDGECRYRATMLAIERGTDIKTVLVKSEERYADEAEMLLNQRLRNSGKPFTVFEDAKHFKRLLALGWLEKDIAVKANISAARVCQILEFNKVSPAVKAIANNGQVSPSLALQVTKDAGSKAEQVLKAGIENAAAEGRTRVLPKDVDAPRQNAKSILKAALEASDIDDTGETVDIHMPEEWYEKVKEALGI
jgi:ParB family chromosome partitioning protein